MLTVIDAADSYDLVTLADAKSALDISGTDMDDKLAAWITQASSAISTYCGRVFAAETVEETFRPSHGCIGLVLSRYPVISITSITEGDQTLSSSDYEADSVSGVINRLWQDRYATWSNSKVVVTYQAGFEAIPESLERATIICLQYYRSADGRDPAIRSASITDIEMLQFFAPTGDALPIEAEALVRPFRMPKVG